MVCAVPIVLFDFTQSAAGHKRNLQVAEIKILVKKITNWLARIFCRR
jgi:hypothetical protein